MQIRSSRISTSIALAITEDGGGDEHFLGDGDAPPTRQGDEGGDSAGDCGSGGDGSGVRRKLSVTTPLLGKRGQGEHQSGDDGSRRANDGSSKVSWLSLVAYFFALFRLHLKRYRPGSFRALRRETWRLDEDEYLSSFPTPIRRHRSTPYSRDSQQRPQGDGMLVPVGDLGYSGSTFFVTPNGRFLIKSLPRRFEHRFFTHELLDPYIAHNETYPDSLLVRITDMPFSPGPSLGGILGTAPTHHIVMENLLYGKESNDDEDDDAGDKWETYDLKPQDYFFPERDIADGRLAPQSVKDRLIDEFPDKVIVVSLDDREKLLATLNHDTQLLASRGAVDYSLFLVRYPQPSASSTDSSSSQRPPALRSGVPCRWREGVDDVEGRWTYRVIVLDFFWAKSALQAKAMTGLVDAYNIVADQGPMSITAEPGEYRTRFMKMVDDLVVAETDSARLE